MAMRERTPSRTIISKGRTSAARVDIMTSEVIIGDAPRRILAQAREWAEANRELLLTTYEEMNA
jgi:hypothetical protein